MRVFALLSLLSLSACGPTTLAGPCKTSCDCNQQLPAPIKCPGAWACNASQTCEYTCRQPCDADGGCPGEATCFSGFCRDFVCL